MKLVTIFLFLFSLSSLASELILTPSQALSQGFKKSPALQIKANVVSPDFTKYSLPWPIEFIDHQHTIGNNMLEYQNYSNEAYYHGGADLRVSLTTEVKAPIDGFLQGHYYSYVVDPTTGGLTKYLKTISEGGDDLYFELSIQTADGSLFELHHVDPRSLPKAIYNMVLKGGDSIKQGEFLGRASRWPNFRDGARYEHIHYNIISSQGVNLNPEYYSHELPDTSAPIINHIFAIYKDKKVEVQNQRLKGLPEELIISSSDIKGDNIYTLPPVLVEAQWGEANKVGWDFTENLFSNSESLPPIFNVYARQVRLSDGRSFKTEGNYSNNRFLFRLKIPPTATGPITLILKDVSGNTKTSILSVE